MIFYRYGEDSKPLILMLTGSFCPAKALEYLYRELSGDYQILVPEYHGHYKGSPSFTTRAGEAREIRNYIIKNDIKRICMVYGQSMGTEIGMELVSQLIKSGVIIGCCFFDGAPMIKLPGIYKQFMYYKFRTMIRMMKHKTIEEVVNWKFLNTFTNGDTESLRPMLEALVTISPFVTDETIKNETECCYTFDYPKMTEDMQRNIYFFYAKDEKACKTCLRKVKKAYPKARFRVVSGYGHMTYSVKNTEDYLSMLKKICSRYV